MKDRIPKYAGRIRLVPVEGDDNLFDMERADEPYEEGTPINASTLLNSEAEENLGLDEDSTPNDAFLAIAEKFGETDTKLNDKAPSYTYSQTDLTAGVSALKTGKLYFVYE